MKIPTFLCLATLVIPGAARGEEPTIPSIEEIMTPGALTTEFEIPETTDISSYGATGQPNEPFRFEYHFASKKLGFTISANQIDERVICRLTYRDGTVVPIELYVNHYRSLLADLIESIKGHKSANSKQNETADYIFVQSISHTERLTMDVIPLSPAFKTWVTLQLRCEKEKSVFTSGD